LAKELTLHHFSKMEKWRVDPSLFLEAAVAAEVEVT